MKLLSLVGIQIKLTPFPQEENEFLHQLLQNRVSHQGTEPVQKHA